MLFENWNSEKLFLFIAIIVGALLVVITPPMCTPDENAHFMNAYSISTGDIFPEVVDGQIGRYVPQKIMDFKNKYTGKYDGKFDEKYDFGTYYFDGWLIGEHTEDIFYSSPLTLISPVGYTFSAIGMSIGSILLGGIDHFATPYNLLLFGRLFNFTFYLICIFYAIKITPYFKNTMMTIALMPMSIYLGASVNYDAILIPISMLLFAIVFKLVFNDKAYIINNKDIAVVLVTSFFLVGIKQAYAPFLLLLLAIPIEKFHDKSRYIKLIVLTLTAGVLGFLPTILMKLVSAGYIDPNLGNILAQKEFLFGNIAMLPHIILNSFRTFAMFYIPGFFGKLGQIDTNFPLPIIVLFYLALFVIVLIDVSIIANKYWKLRVLALISGFISIVGIFYSMYINWTCIPEVAGVGVDFVSGVQGRYFIPMFLFLCIPFINNFISKLKFEKNLIFVSKTVAQVTVIICAVLTIFTVYSRYW